MLCISISKLVLRMPFAGRNHFLSTKTSISIFFCHKQKKRKENTKMTKSMHKKGSTSIKVLHLNAGWHPKAAFFVIFYAFISFFPFVTEKDKKLVYMQKKWFQPANSMPSTHLLVEIKWNTQQKSMDYLHERK